MTEVIAVRRFWWEGQPERELLVSIGKPQKVEGRDFYCAVQTTGFGDDDFVQPIYGIDAFQALELAMRYVGWRVADINQKSGERLRWAAGNNQRIPKEWAQNSPLASDKSP